MSQLVGSWYLLSRKNSRTSRFNLFRRTALPTFLLTPIPSRHRPRLFFLTYTIKPGLAYLFPWQVILLNSVLFKSRSFRLKTKSLFSLKTRLAGWLHYQLCSSLSPPARQDSATGLSGHPPAKAVCPLPLQIVGLISPFHLISLTSSQTNINPIPNHCQGQPG